VQSADGADSDSVLGNLETRVDPFGHQVRKRVSGHGFQPKTDRLRFQSPHLLSVQLLQRGHLGLQQSRTAQEHPLQQLLERSLVPWLHDVDVVLQESSVQSGQRRMSTIPDEQSESR